MNVNRSILGPIKLWHLLAFLGVVALGLFVAAPTLSAAQIAVVLVAVAEGPQFWSTFCPSGLTMRKACESEKDRNDVREGEVFAAIFYGIFVLGASWLAGTWVPAIAGLVMATGIALVYEHFLRTGRGGWSGASMFGGGTGESSGHQETPQAMGQDQPPAGPASPASSSQFAEYGAMR